MNGSLYSFSPFKMLGILTIFQEELLARLLLWVKNFHGSPLSNTIPSYLDTFLLFLIVSKD